jgi:hypothetical protein
LWKGLTLSILGLCQALFSPFILLNKWKAVSLQRFRILLLKKDAKF